jgi:hypothetical protein
MFISQTSLTYFYKWSITCEIQILNLIKWDLQPMWPEALPSCFFCLAKNLWNQGRTFYSDQSEKNIIFLLRSKWPVNLINTVARSKYIHILTAKQIIKCRSTGIFCRSLSVDQLLFWAQHFWSWTPSAGL